MAAELKLWEGTGWPITLFVHERIEKEKSLHCARIKCRRIVRDPWQLGCGHRCCDECLNMMKDENDPICVLCAQNIINDGNGACDQSAMNEIDERVQNKARIDIEKAFVDDNTREEVMQLLVKCPLGCGDGEPGKHFRLMDFMNHVEACYMGKSRRDGSASEVCRVCKIAIPMGQSLFEHFYAYCKGDCPFKCQNKKRSQLLVEHLQTENLRGFHITSLTALQHQVQNPVENGVNDLVHKQTFYDMEFELSCIEPRVRALGMQLLTIGECGDQVPRLVSGLAGVDKTEAELKRIRKSVKRLNRTIDEMVTRDEVFKRKANLVNQIAAETDEYISRLNRRSKLSDATNIDIKMRIDDHQKGAFNGTLVWKVEAAIDLLMQAKDGQQFSMDSPPFFTDVYGYKMCMRLYSNGYNIGEGTHISLFLVALKGEYDPLLQWPFKSEVYVVLRNLSEANKSITAHGLMSIAKSHESMNVSSMWPQFAEQSIIYAPQNGYVVDDCMFISVTVVNKQEPRHTQLTSADIELVHPSPATAYAI